MDERWWWWLLFGWMFSFATDVEIVLNWTLNSSFLDLFFFFLDKFPFEYEFVSMFCLSVLDILNYHSFVISFLLLLLLIFLMILNWILNYYPYGFEWTMPFVLCSCMFGRFHLMAKLINNPYRCLLMPGHWIPSVLMNRFMYWTGEFIIK